MTQQQLRVISPAGPDRRLVAVPGPRPPADDGSAPGPCRSVLDNLRLDQLRSFVVLAEELHFTRAARRLHLSQPGLSRRLDIIERETGATLINRGSRRIELTAAGKVLVSHATALLAAAETASRALEAHTRRAPER